RQLPRMPGLVCQSSWKTLPPAGLASRAPALRRQVLVQLSCSSDSNLLTVAGALCRGGVMAMAFHICDMAGCGEITAESGSYDPHKGLRKKTAAKECANQQYDRKPQTESNVCNLFPPFVQSAREYFSVGPQHVNRRNDHTPKRKHG